MTLWREPWDDAPFPDLSTDQLGAIVSTHALGIDPGDIVRMPSTGVVNAVWALGDELVLRVPKAIPAAVVDVLTESVAVPVACAAGVRTPELVIFDESCGVVDVPFTVYARVHADPLLVVGDPGDHRGVWRELGRQLAVLHQGVAECPDPQGRLDRPGRSDDAAELVAAAVADGWINVDNARQLEAWFDALQPAVEAASGLCRFLHDDTQPSNLLVSEHRLVAIIDWGDAGWGDPALDLRYLPGRAVADALVGYREVAPMDLDETAEARIWRDHLWSALYALRRGTTDRRGDWNRPPGARLFELLALLDAGGGIGRFV